MRAICSSSRLLVEDVSARGGVFLRRCLPKGGVSPGRGCLPRGCLPREGVSAQGGGVCPGSGCLPGTGCLPRDGVSAQGWVSAQGGGVCPGRGVCPRGCCPGRECLPRERVYAQGGVCPRGVSARGVHIPACTGADTPLWTEWRTGVNIYYLATTSLRMVKIGTQPINELFSPHRLTKYQV